MPDRYSGVQKRFEIGQTELYAPKLRMLGLKLKRREEPRAPNERLSFTQSLSDAGPIVPPNPLTPRYTNAITLTTKSEKTSGYIVVIFDRPYASCTTNFITSEFLIGDVSNESLRTLITQNSDTNYVLHIVENPFVPRSSNHRLRS